jgi:hypothetical protein
MEKRINTLVEDYTLEFKKELCDKIMNVLGDSEQSTQLVHYVYNYDRLILGTEDFAKRKRVKNEVPYSDRCMAKRSCGEQCTRRKKDGQMFCGTHVKGVPHGTIDTNEEGEQVHCNKVEVWLQDFKGISYYIDKNTNVYQTEDIVSNKRNPKIIAKYVFDNGEYSIPNYGI